MSEVVQAALTAAEHACAQRNFVAAERTLITALHTYPSPDLERALAHVYRQSGRIREAEDLLRSIANRDPRDLDTSLELAWLYRNSGRTQTAARIVLDTLHLITPEADTAIRASLLLWECGEIAGAAEQLDRSLSVTPDDPRLHVRAAMLAMQRGHFDDARRHYLATLANQTQACEWHVPAGLAAAQRYADAKHADFSLFQRLATRDDLSTNARASLQFALGKAHDDIGEYASATRWFRAANANVHEIRRWQRKSWRRSIAPLLSTPPIRTQIASRTSVVPVLMVGMPRSGSTLAATRLEQYPNVCNRGEMPWLGNLTTHPALAGCPSMEALAEAARVYAMHLQRDDVVAHWFIDKQPFNFRYIDIFLAMFPQARIVYCTRNSRDTALSLWTQSFSDDIQGYTCDFADIEVVMHDCTRLMARWRSLHADAIYDLEYESLVADPTGTIAQLADWLGLPPLVIDRTHSPNSISTASLWQARQPVHRRSVARWRHYMQYVPELARFPLQ